MPEFLPQEKIQTFQFQVRIFQFSSHSYSLLLSDNPKSDGSLIFSQLPLLNLFQTPLVQYFCHC